MENQKEHLKSVINRLESLDTDWKENKHLFIVKNRRLNHFPTMKKLKIALFILGGGSLLWRIFISYMSQSVVVFLLNFIVVLLIFGIPIYRYYQKVVEYKTAVKHYEDKRRSLLFEIENLKNKIKY